MREILFFQKVFKEKIWGSDRLKTLFDMNIPSDHTGECWVISGHPSGQTEVLNGTFAGWTLQDIWGKRRDIFGHIEGEEFPLLVKIIDACDDLSIQVHPDEHYAMSKPKDVLPKTECWYILDCEDGAEIILGHKAQTREDFEQMVREGKWEELLQRIPVKKGDFVYVPSGTVHALTTGILVLEIQQSSDTTYRLYDYDRLENGVPRELHIEESLEVVRVPHSIENQMIQVETYQHATKSILTETPYFSVYKFDIDGQVSLHQDKPFMIMGVVEGAGSIDGYPVKRGDHFILPCDYGDFMLEGTMSLIASTKE